MVTELFTMYRSVIFLVVNINLLVESVPDFENINYNIQFNLPIAHYFGNFDVNHTFVVLRDKPFTITLVDYTSVGADCRSKHKSFSLTWYVEMIAMAKGKWNSVIKVQRAEEHMSLEWMCTFGRKNDPDQIITFKVRVKGVPKIKVTVGGLELNNSLSESTELTYDNIAYYWYEEGETIDLVCHNLNAGLLYIVYYDQNGLAQCDSVIPSNYLLKETILNAVIVKPLSEQVLKLIETDRMWRQRPPNFQKIMHIDDNNYIVDCKFEMIYNFHPGYAYRTIFKLRPEASSSKIIAEQEDSLDVRMKRALLKENSQKGSKEGLDEAVANFRKRNGPVKFQRVYSTKITVNNLKLIPTNVSAHRDKEDYQYNFFEDQILKVSCERNKDLPGHLLFGTDNNEHLKSRILEEVENNLWKKTITLDTKDLTMEHLRCEIIGYSTANIMLVLDTKELYILGLLTDNVMYQYRNNSTTWILDYKYSVNETLNLTCGARTESDLRWIFGNVTTKAKLKSKDINDVFTLQADHNEMKIICEGKNIRETSKFFVNLHRVDSTVEDVLFNITPVVYSDFSNTYKTYVVLANMPFNITLFNYNASEARCCRYYNGFYNFPIKLENVVEENKFNSIIMVPSASEDMSTVWKCTLKKVDSPDQYVIFDMRVKGKNNLNITIGGLEQKPAVLDFLEVGCDAISHYWYEAGEAIDLDCVNLHAGGTIQLRYYDKNCTKLIETDPLWQVPINFRKTMYSSNDGDMIDCTYKTEYYDYKYTHRTVFKVKTESSSKRVINIDVNNFQLVPITVTDGNRSLYQYKYHEGETLMVTCEKDRTAPGYLQFESDEIEFMERNQCCAAELQEQNLWLKKNTIKLNTKNLNGKHLTCNLTDDQLISTADIMFLVETKQLYIIGLPMSDMIFQYRKNMSTWILDYKYSKDQVLYLTCVTTTESNLHWIYSNNSEEFHNKTKSISSKFALRSEVKKMTITCEATDIETMYIQRVTVNLHRVKKSLRTPESTITDIAVDTTNSNVIVIISFSVATLVSVFGITIACCTCIKRKDTSGSQNETSRNRHQSRPLPEVPRPRKPLYCYDYVYSSSYDYPDLPPDETNNNDNQQNTLYYWAYQ